MKWSRIPAISCVRSNALHATQLVSSMTNRHFAVCTPRRWSFFSSTHQKRLHNRKLVVFENRTHFSSNEPPQQRVFNRSQKKVKIWVSFEKLIPRSRFDNLLGRLWRGKKWNKVKGIDDHDGKVSKPVREINETASENNTNKRKNTTHKWVLLEDKNREIQQRRIRAVSARYTWKFIKAVRQNKKFENV